MVLLQIRMLCVAAKQQQPVCFLPDGLPEMWLMLLKVCILTNIAILYLKKLFSRLNVNKLWLITEDSEGKAHNREKNRLH